MKMTKTAMMVFRLAALFQIVVGAALWSGKWRPILDLHRTVGIVYVVCLWIICAVALRAQRKVGLAMLGIIWGIVIAGIGFAQTGIMRGDSHWMVQVGHLVISLLAFPIAEILAKGAPTAKRNG